MTDDVTTVRRYLADIPQLVAEASHYLTPGIAPKDKLANHGTIVYKIPIVPEIADILDDREKDVEDVTDSRNRTQWQWVDGKGRKVTEPAGQRRLGVLPSLGLWVSLTYTELEDLGQTPRECCPARKHTISGETNWLADYAEIIIELHPDFPRDIEQLWTELRKACRIRNQYVPECPHCGWKVESIYGSDKDQAPAWLRCPGCAKTWVMDAELKRFALTQPKMTLRQIATWLNIPLRTLHNWRNQGRFNTDHRGLAEVEHVKRAAETAGRLTA